MKRKSPPKKSGLAFIKHFEGQRLTAKLWAEIAKVDTTRVESVGLQIATLLNEAKRNKDSELLANIAEMLVQAVTSTNQIDAEVLDSAKQAVDPWPLALSGDPRFTKAWEEERVALRAVWEKGSTPRKMPNSNSALGPLIDALVKVMTFQGKIPELLSMENIPMMEREVIKQLEAHRNWPNGELFAKVNPQNRDNLPGVRSKELRQNIREYFRTMKRRLKTGEVL